MKKLILITGEKGGVGKSFFARSMMAKFWTENGEYPYAVDTDASNPTLSRFYPRDSVQINLAEQSQLDEIVNKFEDGIDTILVDGAARSLGYFLEWMRDVNFSEVAKELEISIEVYFVIGGSEDSLQLLNQYVGVFGSSVNWTVVKNRMFTQRFDLYEKSKTRKLILEDLGGREVNMPELYPNVVETIDTRRSPFEFAKDLEDFRLIEKQRICAFNRRFMEEMSSCQ